MSTVAPFEKDSAGQKLIRPMPVCAKVKQSFVLSRSLVSNATFLEAFKTKLC